MCHYVQRCLACAVLAIIGSGLLHSEAVCSDRSERESEKGTMEKSLDDVFTTLNRVSLSDFKNVLDWRTVRSSLAKADFKEYNFNLPKIVESVSYVSLNVDHIDFPPDSLLFFLEPPREENGSEYLVDFFDKTTSRVCAFKRAHAGQIIGTGRGGKPPNLKKLHAFENPSLYLLPFSNYAKAEGFLNNTGSPISLNINVNDTFPREPGASFAQSGHNSTIACHVVVIYKSGLDKLAKR
jgi:hypothetical protein